MQYYHDHVLLGYITEIKRLQAHYDHVFKFQEDGDLSYRTRGNQNIY